MPGIPKSRPSPVRSTHEIRQQARRTYRGGGSRLGSVRRVPGAKSPMESRADFPMVVVSGDVHEANNNLSMTLQRTGRTTARENSRRLAAAGEEPRNDAHSGSCARRRLARCQNLDFARPAIGSGKRNKAGGGVGSSSLTHARQLSNSGDGGRQNPPLTRYRLADSNFRRRGLCC